jgi:hypothetical protein
MRGALLFATGTSDAEQHEEIRHEQGGEAAPLPQSRIMLRPVRDPVSRLRNMMTMCGVMLEWHNSFQS